MFRNPFLRFVGIGHPELATGDVCDAIVRRVNHPKPASLLGGDALSLHSGVIWVIRVIRTLTGLPGRHLEGRRSSIAVLLSAASGSRQRLQRPLWHIMIATAQGGDTG